MTNRIVRYFPDTHLGNSHQGLADIASKHKIRVNALEIGEFVVFVNKKQNALKMFASGNVIAYLKTPDGRRLHPKAIGMIPNFFNGREIKYDAVLTEVINKEFKIN